MAIHEDEQDPADALRRLLAERERAKRSVYAAHIAREKAEEETAHKEKLLDMQIEEGQRLAAENAGLRSDMADLKDKERARSQIIDTLTKRAGDAERRKEILETILGRVEDELHDAILEEDDFAPLDDIEKDTGEESPAPPVAPAFDYSEDTRREMEVAARPVAALPNPLKALVNSLTRLSCRARLYLVAAVSAPFLLMVASMALASRGVYIDALRPLWTDAIGDEVKVIFGLLVPLNLFTFWYFKCGRRNRHRIDSTENVPAIEQRAEREADTAGDDEYVAALREIFGEEDDDDREAPGD